MRLFFLLSQRVIFSGVCENCLYNTLSSTDNDDDYSPHRFRRIIIGQLDSRTLLCCYYFAASFKSFHRPPDDGLYQPHLLTCHQSLTRSKVTLIPLCVHPSTFSLDTRMAVNVPFSTNRRCWNYVSAQSDLFSSGGKEKNISTTATHYQILFYLFFFENEIREKKERLMVSGNRTRQFYGIVCLDSVLNHC